MNLVIKQYKSVRQIYHKFDTVSIGKLAQRKNVVKKYLTTCQVLFDVTTMSFKEKCLFLTAKMVK